MLVVSCTVAGGAAPCTYSARARRQPARGHCESYSSYSMRANYNVQLPFTVNIFLQVFAYSAFLNGKI